MAKLGKVLIYISIILRISLLLFLCFITCPTKTLQKKVGFTCMKLKLIIVITKIWKNYSFVLGINPKFSMIAISIVLLSPNC
jgi:hypothetical protein